MKRTATIVMLFLALGDAAGAASIRYEWEGGMEPVAGSDNPWGLAGDGSALTQNDGTPFTVEVIVDAAAPDTDCCNPNYAIFTGAVMLTIGGNAASVTLGNPPFSLQDDAFEGSFDALSLNANVTLFGVTRPVSFNVRVPANTFALSDEPAPDAPPAFESTLPSQFGGAGGSDLVTYPANAPVSGSPDSDDDNLVDRADNCVEVANTDQRDTDADGIGNFCDGDFNNDCAQNFIDLGLMQESFFQAGDLHTDMDGDMTTNFSDLGLLKTTFFMPPGPSAPPHVCD